MKRITSFLLAATALTLPALAQDAPQLSYTAADILKLPKGQYFGEVAGVATNSKGHVFVLEHTGNPTASIGGSRTFVHGGTQLMEFDASGKFVREIGRGIYGWLVGNAVRVDAHDNVWAVDRASGMVIKFNPDGSDILMLLGRKPESINVPTAPAGGGGRGAAAAGGAEAAAAPAGGRGGAAGRGGRGAGGGGRGGRVAGAGGNQDVFTGPTDVAWDAAGNIFVAEGYGGNTRVAKFTPDGVFIKSFGHTGTDNDSFASPRSLAVDAANNIYVADRGNHRIQVLDDDLNYKSSITGIGDPWAICISGNTLYSSNSNPVNDLDSGGEIYKLSLTGTVQGRFGKAGKQSRDFGTVNGLDCHGNTLWTAEVGNYRAQKITLK